MTEQDAEEAAESVSVEYEQFLSRKVALARASIKAGHSYSNEEIEAEFAARRQAVI